MQELLSMDMWGAVLIAVIMLLGLMQGMMAWPGDCHNSVVAGTSFHCSNFAEHMAPRCEC